MSNINKIQRESTAGPGGMRSMPRIFLQSIRPSSLFILTLCLILSLACHSFAKDSKKPAEEKQQKPIIADSACEATPQISIERKTMIPAKYTNNLRRKSGNVHQANGEYLAIVGRVLDINCVPIVGAVVKIYQADSSGKYEDEYLTKGVWQQRDKSYDNNFNYSGQVTTDNLGRFSFLTILPGAKEDTAPHIDFAVSHQDFKKITTRMYFENHPNNSSDQNLKKIPADKQKQVIASGAPIDPTRHYDGRLYRFDIVLDGISGYRLF